MRVRNARFVLSILCASALVAGCSADGSSPGSAGSPEPPAAPVRTLVAEPTEHTVLLDATDPAELALTASQQVFERSSVAVLVAEGTAGRSGDGSDGSDGADGSAGEGSGESGAVVSVAQASAAEALGAPALVVGETVSADGVATELDRLGVQVAVVVGTPRSGDDGTFGGPAPSGAERAARTAGAAVVPLEVSGLPGPGDVPAGTLSATAEADLRAQVEAALAAGSSPPPSEAPRLTEVLALTDPRPGQEAAIATLRAAGAVDHAVPGGDIAASSEAIGEIDAAQALAVVGVGPSFGDADDFAWRVETAERGELLPTGTQHLLPAHYVTATADPWDEPADVVDRAAAAAGAYADLGDGPVVPTVVVPASSPSPYPGEDGDRVDERPTDELEPMVEAAREAGQYVLLDVAVGAAPMRDELEPLEDLLARPGVGVALHPEQRRAPGAIPARVPMAEMESAIAYIEGVVTKHALPPAMVVVHQTRPESVVDRAHLADVAAGTDAVEIVLAADRTGGTTTGEWVWGRVTDDVPDGVHAGWAGPSALPAEATHLVPTDPVPLVVAGP